MPPVTFPISAPALRTLTPDEIASYQANGFVVVDDVLAPQELDALDRMAHERHLARLAELRAAPLDPQDVRTRQERENHLYGLADAEPMARSLSEDPRLVSLVRPVVGPGVCRTTVVMFSKSPREIEHTCHWHQDDAYFHYLPPSTCRVSAWIPLIDAGPHNGGLRVVPGHYRRDVLPHAPRSQHDHGSCRLSFAPGEQRMPGEQSLLVRKGSVLLFSSRLIHASSGNSSDQHRRTFIVTYQEATSGVEAHQWPILVPA